MDIKSILADIGIGWDKGSFEITSLNNLKQAEPEHLSFFYDLRFKSDLLNTKAKFIITKEDFIEYMPKYIYPIVSKNPSLVMAKASKLFSKPLVSKIGKEPLIGQGCVICDNVSIGKNTIIGDNTTILAGTYIGEGVSVGNGSIIYSNVSIYNNTQIGSNTFIHAGSVIGSDGFGYANDENGKHIKIYHNGNVIIGDNVEIGANTTIDRSVFASTIIKSGTVIDNLVQIGHNCIVGEDCIIVSQTGIAGSTKIGKGVVMGGQSATTGHLEIGDYSKIGARGALINSIKPYSVYSGAPAIPHKDFLRTQVAIHRLVKKRKK